MEAYVHAAVLHGVNYDRKTRVKKQLEKRVISKFRNVISFSRGVSITIRFDQEFTSSFGK